MKKRRQLNIGQKQNEEQINRQPSAEQSNSARQEEMSTGLQEKNPKLLVSSEKGWDLKHRGIGFEDGIGGPAESIGHSKEKEKKEVRLKRTEDNPIRRKSLTNEKSLFQERPKTKKKTNQGDWQSVRVQKGDLENPITSNHFVGEDLFLKNKPKKEDIIQGGIGSCYFLAAMGSIVQSDPKKIPSMMEIQGDSVTVQFYRFDSNAPDGQQWVPAPIQIDTSLLQWVSQNDKQNSQLFASTFRIGENLKYAEWHADVENKSLIVKKDAYYEAAIWAPLMEKAFARFSELYGQYGDALGDDSTESGYSQIEGGLSNSIYPLFYGNDVQATDYYFNRYDPANSQEVDLDLVQLLLQHQGVGLEQDEKMHLTTSISPNYSMERLTDQIHHIFIQEFLKNYSVDFYSDLHTLYNRLLDWSSTVDVSEKLIVREDIVKLVQEMITPNKWGFLNSDVEEGEFRRLQDLLLVVNQLGDDSGIGQRFVYAWHAYTIVDSRIHNHQNQRLSLSLADLAANQANISPTLSTITIRNPHGRNVEDRLGTGDPGNDGFMDVTLEEFQRVFKQFEHTTVKK